MEDRLRRSSARTASTSGRSRSCRCACRRSSTCAPIRSRQADHEGMDYEHWRIDRAVPARAGAGNTSAQFLATFKEFPPSQKVGSFSRSTRCTDTHEAAPEDDPACQRRRTSGHDGPFHCCTHANCIRSRSSRVAFIAAAAAACGQTRCPPGTTARPSSPSSTSSRRVTKRRLAGLRAARRAHRRPSTTTARSGPSSRSTSSSSSPSTASRRWRRSTPSGRRRSLRVAAQGRHEGVARRRRAGAGARSSTATHAGMTTDEFEQIVSDWIATAKHPKTGRPYTEMVYQPMLELLRLPARERLQDLHRLRRRHRVHAAVDRRRSMASRRSRSSAAAARLKFEMRDGKPVLDAGCRSRLHRRQGRASRSASSSSSAGARSPPSATPTATCRCCNGPATAPGRRLGLYRPPHRCRPRVGLRPRLAHRPLDKGLDEASCQRLDRRRHEEGLEQGLRLRVRRPWDNQRMAQKTSSTRQSRSP